MLKESIPVNHIWHAVAPYFKKCPESTDGNTVFKLMFDALKEEPDSDLVDQITYEPMNDPVVLSSGIVLDRNSVFTD